MEKQGWFDINGYPYDLSKECKCGSSEPFDEASGKCKPCHEVGKVGYNGHCWVTAVCPVADNKYSGCLSV